ncbi:hypothetical protein CP533_3896 [Ophiocordyceps camponoti-saundersi (nom. inval.)]|nr:hypothetical protein CP533_3896 [Ophiocordyceps camponoti-saundersi (nom. inval.)]
MDEILYLRLFEKGDDVWMYMWSIKLAADEVARIGSCFLVLDPSHAAQGAAYQLRLAKTEALSSEDVDSCLALVRETSGDAYRASNAGWRPRAKRREMCTPGLRYVLVCDGRSGKVVGFVSFMLTWEAGEAVVYCYEIHLEDFLRG